MTLTLVVPDTTESIGLYVNYTDSEGKKIQKQVEVRKLEDGSIIDLSKKKENR